MIRALLLSIMLGATAQVRAQAYPTHPVKLIVPYGVGGPAGIYGRFLAT